MDHCMRCGSPVESSWTHCANCGNLLPTKTIPVIEPTSSQTSPSTVLEKRPMRVKIVLILAILNGIVSFLSATGAFRIGVFLANPQPAFPLTIATQVEAELIFLIFYFVLLGSVSLVVAYGFWKRTSWAWWLGVVSGVLGVLSIFVPDFFTLIIGIFVLYYITRRDVKAWFPNM